MSIRLIGKNKFQLVDSIDGYIHKVYLYSMGNFFYLNVRGKEECVPIRFGKETFLQKLSELNSKNDIISIEKEDFEEIRSYLKNPEKYLKELEELNESKIIFEKEEKIMSERTPEEDYEAQTENYNPEFDNFNIDDFDSSFFDAE